jgi:hypothetical protein
MTALISPTSLPRQAAAAASAIQLEITAGLHQGVCLALDLPAYLIGSGAGADLLLSDAGVAAAHLLLRLERGTLAIEARGGDVHVIDAAGRSLRVPMGNGHRAHLPVDLQLGTAQLRLREAAAAKAHTAPLLSRRHGQWLCAALFMGLCAAAFGSFSLQRDHSAMAMRAKAGGAEAPVALAATNTATVEQAQLWLAEQLQTAQLTRIEIGPRDGGLSAQGSVTPAQRSAWTSVQQAFDRRYGQAIVLHPQVSVSSVPATPRVRFQAVFFGPHPYVISDTGKRLYPGAAVADDWVLERIEADQVILARGTERFTFTL